MRDGIANRFSRDEKQIAVHVLRQDEWLAIRFDLYRKVELLAHTLAEFLQRTAEPVRERIVTEVAKRLPRLIQGQPQLNAGAVQILAHAPRFATGATRGSLEQSRNSDATLNHRIVHLARQPRPLRQSQVINAALLARVKT